jgi:diguanylate cyclase (GGDEF)-like protein
LDRFRQLEGPIAAGVTWLALALAELWLRDSGHAVLLLWLPSAVAVAALHGNETRRWPAFLAALALAEVSMGLMIGFTFLSGLGYAAASTAEALLCTCIGMRVLGGRGRLPASLWHIAGLFAAALIGSAASAVIVYPFRPATGLFELARWFFAEVLGLLVGVPLMLFLRQRLGFGDQSVRMHESGESRGLLPLAAAMFAVAVIVLDVSDYPMLWLLVAAMVFAAVRHGQLGAAVAVFAFAAAATLASYGGGNPVKFLTAEPARAGLVLQVFMLAMLAVSLPIAATLLTRARLEAQLREQNGTLHESLTTLRLAERLVGVGCWRYDIRSGRQHWSELMLEINGLPRDLPPDPGNMRSLLPDGGEALFAEIARQRASREPYSFEYRIHPPGKAERVLRMVVTNEFEGDKRVALFAVAIDVTEQVRREEALEVARSRAMLLAAEAQKLAMTDSLTGLANRRCALDWLDRLLKASADEGFSLALVIFDIDHFKAINDCFGHPTGDAVLRRVAEIARNQVRGDDVIGRIGGEEFLGLLPEVGVAAARQRAEQLRVAIERGTSKGGDLPRATISLGLAQVRPGDTAERLLARADAALYQAKQGGRNKVHRAA